MATPSYVESLILDACTEGRKKLLRVMNVIKNGKRNPLISTEAHDRSDVESLMSACRQVVTYAQMVTEYAVSTTNDPLTQEMNTYLEELLAKLEDSPYDRIRREHIARIRKQLGMED